jgi:hypothetical protein
MMCVFIRKRECGVRRQWFTPVILDTQEAEIRKIVVQSQPGQIVLCDPISKKPFTEEGWWSGSRGRP